MAEKTFDELFVLATAESGQSYLEARNGIIELHANTPTSTINNLAVMSQDVGNWRRQLVGQIITGWVTQKATYDLCTSYMKGDLPGPKPLPGFTASHRAKALVSIGEPAIPRLLEITWKTQEYASSADSSAVFSALAMLKDQRSVMPMFELIRGDTSGDVKTSAINVLAELDHPQVMTILMEITDDLTVDKKVRLYAIRSLGEQDSPEASNKLVNILLDETVSSEVRIAAAEGLETRLDPTTREAVVEALGKTWNETLVLTLVSVLAEIGAEEDIPEIERLNGYRSDVNDAVNDAIESIRARQ